jgi:hypothetical protein
MIGGIYYNLAMGFWWGGKNRWTVIPDVHRDYQLGEKRFLG